MRRLAYAAAVAAVLAAPGCGRVLGLRSYTAAAQSMEPTIRAGEHVLCSTRATPRRGSVVVIRRFVEDPIEGKKYLFRVVGLPGDRVRVDDSGSAWVDGSRLDEPYVNRDDVMAAPEVTVPPHSYWVLGDNRGRSADSRYRGRVERADVEAVCTRIRGRGRIAGT